MASPATPRRPVPNPLRVTPSWRFAAGRGPVEEERLDSWKQIAAYFERDVRTVQRWERQEGMPVRRHPHKARSSVYAFRGELHQWLNSRAIPPVSDPGGNHQSSPAGLPGGNPLWRRAGAILGVVLGAIWRRGL